MRMYEVRGNYGNTKKRVVTSYYCLGVVAEEGWTFDGWTVSKMWRKVNGEYVYVESVSRSGYCERWYDKRWAPLFPID